MMNFVYYFFFNDTATTEIYTLSLHDALPIFRRSLEPPHQVAIPEGLDLSLIPDDVLAVYELATGPRSEEHTSELQSRQYLVCRLLLDKKYQLKVFPTGQHRRTVTLHGSLHLL